MPVSPNTEKTTTAAAPSLSELHVSYFGDEIALNLLPALAVKRLSNRGQPIALTRGRYGWDSDYGLRHLWLGSTELGLAFNPGIQSIHGALGWKPDQRVDWSVSS